MKRTRNTRLNSLGKIDQLTEWVEEATLQSQINFIKLWPAVHDKWLFLSGIEDLTEASMYTLNLGKVFSLSNLFQRALILST